MYPSSCILPCIVFKIIRKVQVSNIWFEIVRKFINGVGIVIFKYDSVTLFTTLSRRARFGVIYYFTCPPVNIYDPNVNERTNWQYFVNFFNNAVDQTYMSYMILLKWQLMFKIYAFSNNKKNTFSLVSGWYWLYRLTQYF